MYINDLAISPLTWKSYKMDFFYEYNIKVQHEAKFKLKQKILNKYINEQGKVFLHKVP